MSISPVGQASTPTQITTQNVSAAVRQQADHDGDGKTGTAALNDGDAAARAAAQEVKAAAGAVNVKA